MLQSCWPRVGKCTVNVLRIRMRVSCWANNVQKVFSIWWTQTNTSSVYYTLRRYKDDPSFCLCSLSSAPSRIMVVLTFWVMCFLYVKTAITTSVWWMRVCKGFANRCHLAFRSVSHQQFANAFRVASRIVRTNSHWVMRINEWMR